MSNLNNINKESPFKVPENYFTNLNAEIMNIIPDKEQIATSSKIVPIWKRVLPWSAIAAMVAGVLITVGVFNKDNSQTNNSGALAAEEHNHNHGSGVCEEEALASSYAEDFYLFVEDQATHAAYEDAFLID